MNSRILVRDFMKPLKAYFKPETSVEEVVKAMVQNHVMGGPVLGQNKELLGFITEQDCLKQMLNDSYYCEDHEIAANIMSTNTLSVSPDEDIVKLAQMILNKLPKCYPVVEDNKVIGMITRTDILKALSLNRVESCRV
ncbi:MAG: CBS domain-containing protein [Hahellaceae bacterium]|nr:CBS domain-containing protein [Hahellaceae bacterium]